MERRHKEEAAEKECEAERQMRREVEAREVRKKNLSLLVVQKHQWRRILML